MTAHWDISWLIWTIILASAAAICWIVAISAVAWYFIKARTGPYSNSTLSGPTALIAAVAALVIGAIGTWQALPFSGQYHRYVPKSGIVQQVGSRFLASDTQGGGTTQKYVVTFTNGQSYGCLDTRCANVTVGDKLTLVCERSFQFNAPDEGWDCNWGVDRKPNGEVIP